MRVSREEKDKSHARIIASASRLFRERGLGGASVGDVMLHAGLTHGGFYKHFETKDALAESAMAAAFSDFLHLLETDNSHEAFVTFRALYLSDGHKANPGIGCPVAALGQEVARGADALKASFGAGVNRVVSAIAQSMKGSASARRTAAIREFSMLVGAMVIARASDDATANEVLAACREGARDAH